VVSVLSDYRIDRKGYLVGPLLMVAALHCLTYDWEDDQLAKIETVRSDRELTEEAIGTSWEFWTVNVSGTVKCSLEDVVVLYNSVATLKAWV
jgi:hypothetical protein